MKRRKCTIWRICWATDKAAVFGAKPHRQIAVTKAALGFKETVMTALGAGDGVGGKIGGNQVNASSLQPARPRLSSIMATE